MKKSKPPLTNARAAGFGLLLTLSLLNPACGPGSQSSSPQSTAAPAVPLPETNGSMKFQPAKEPGSETPQASDTPKPTSDDPQTIDTTPVSTARHPLCLAAHDPAKQLPGLTCPVCLQGQFTQPDAKRRKIDILFVADSSPSLESQRREIGRGVEQFLKQLPAETDYRLAVMPAHSDVSYDPKRKPSTGLAGHLITSGNEPAVLKGSDYRSFADLARILVPRLTKMQMDSASDGGELGLFSLDHGISEPLLSENQRLGFFRADAALAVIFISDENDICSYDTDDYPAGVQPKKNVNIYQKPDLTVEMRASQFYCKGEAGRPVVTSHSVRDKLVDLKKIIGSDNQMQPLIITGILYTDPSKVPTVMPADEKYPQYFFEKEFGYGYVNLIRSIDPAAVMVDITDANFNDGLKKIGEQAAHKLEVKTAFNLKDGASVDRNTLCVVVDGKEVKQIDDFGTRVDGLSYIFNGDTRDLNLRGIGARNVSGGASKVDVFYCEPPSVIEFDPERFSEKDIPSSGEHYRHLPVPSACASVRSSIQSGKFDHL